MPRGAPKGGRNNNLLSTSATKEDMERLTRQALDSYLLSGQKDVDLHDEESVNRAIIGYFQSCIDNGTRPGNLGLYAALGMSRQDYNNVITGKSKRKVSPTCLDMLKRAVRAIGAFREGLALEGKLNPVTYIFMGKNFDHLSDVQQIEVSAASQQSADLTPEEVAKRIESDVPIDAEYTDL